MAEYHQETAVIKDHDFAEETDRRQARDARMSRREFIRDTAIGAASAAIALKSGERVQAQSSESGQVTVDGILLSYVASPLGSIASTSQTFTKSHATTMRLVAASNRSLSIGANASILGFSVGSTTFRQTNSTQVTDAITVRRSIADMISTPAPGAIGNTVFIGLLAPEMQFDGDTSRVLFRFLSATDKFAVTQTDLQNNGAGGVFRSTTVDSFLSQYVTDPGQLVKPRFKLRSSILLSAGVRDVFTFTKSTGSAHSESKTRTSSVEITRRFGFNILVANLTFEVGSRIEVTTTAVQEFSADHIISSQTTLERTSLGVNKVYWDRVFKTFTVIDAGPPAPLPIVQGRVVDNSGNPIANAVVRVQADNAEYAALSDSNGNYGVKLASGDNWTPGVYPVISGTDSANVYIDGSTPATANLASDPAAAQDTTMSGEALLLN